MEGKHKTVGLSMIEWKHSLLLIQGLVDKIKIQTVEH